MRLVRKFGLLLLAVIPLYIHAQEVKDAATVEQCRADRRLWLSKLEDPNDISINKVSFDELQGWAWEMIDCFRFDLSSQSNYANTVGEINAVMILRLRHFIERRNLYYQFVAEDAQGKR